MAKARWTPLAEADLDAILLFIANEGGRPETAVRLYFEMRAAVDAHAAAGGPHPCHPALPKDWSYLMFKRWLIAYKPEPDAIVVRRVVDASRDLPEQFKEA
jgi:plasmid stabilization system protein ParE